MEGSPAMERSRDTGSPSHTPPSPTRIPISSTRKIRSIRNKVTHRNNRRFSLSIQLSL